MTKNKRLLMFIRQIWKIIRNQIGGLKRKLDTAEELDRYEKII